MKKIVYQCDNKGFYLGETIAYNGLLPSNAVEKKPNLKDGFIPSWNGKSWEQIENHKGERGYVNNQPFTIVEYGAYPDGWTTEYSKSFDELKSEKLIQANQIFTVLSARLFEVGGMSFPKDMKHCYEWLTFAKYKAMGIIDSKAVVVDCLGFDMNSHSVEAIEGYMYQLMREVTNLNAENKSLLDRINLAKTVDDLENIEIVIPEG